MNHKFAVVTGASTGIGRTVAVELGKRGCSIALIARNTEKLEETKKLVEEVGGKATCISCDLAIPGAVHGLIEKIKAKSEEVNFLFNIAGVWHGKKDVYAGKDFETFSEETIIETVSVGLMAPTLISRGLISVMPNGSSIINISGTFEGGAKGWLPYYVSKRAIEDLTISLAEELGDKGINVNCVSPSDTATEEYKKYFPDDAKDAQSPEEVAKFAVELTQKQETGKVYVIKNGQITEGFHK